MRVAREDGAGPPIFRLGRGVGWAGLVIVLAGLVIVLAGIGPLAGSTVAA